LTACSVALTAAPRPLVEIVGAWAALAARLPRPLPFDRPAWHETWWSRFGGARTPLYLAIEADGDLAAVLPLLRDGDTLALAGDPEICDYTRFPAAVEPSPALLDAALTAVDALDWRTVHLWGLPEDSPALAPIAAWGAARGYRVEEDFEAVCPRLPLPADWDGYLASLTKKDRHELKRKLRRLEEAGTGLAFRALSDPEAVAGVLDAFFHLHRVSRHDKAEFMSPAMEGFFREMAVRLAAEDAVRLFLVELNGGPVAALLAFLSGDELLLYNSGYDPAYAHASVGLISKALTLRWAIESGLRTFDFLRGAEPYKYDLGGRDRAVRQLWIHRDV
jgi:CelD/BcsL family acetyltransferase involved in cellulose biosynthesis